MVLALTFDRTYSAQQGVYLSNTTVFNFSLDLARAHHEESAETKIARFESVLGP